MSEKDNLWCLGNTTIRNPERLPGALKVFIEKFHGKLAFTRQYVKIAGLSPIFTELYAL